MTNDSPFAPAYEVGVIVFADTDTGDRVVEGLREVGATHLVNDISILEHHENGRFSVHDYAQGATKGTKVGKVKKRCESGKVGEALDEWMVG